jgi:hypothetical protein
VQRIDTSLQRQIFHPLFKGIKTTLYDTSHGQTLAYRTSLGPSLQL